MRIERPGRTRDTAGQPVVTSRDTVNVPAEIRTAGGSEQRRRDQTDPGNMLLVSIRYRSDVDTKCRVVHGGRSLNIVSVEDPDGRQRELLLRCQA